MAIVSVQKCEKYDYDLVKSAVDKSFEALGGIGKFIKPGMKVLLKVNLVMKKPPEDAATTNPVLVEALANAITAAGGLVYIADSPGGLYTQNILKETYDVCGITQAARRSGALLNFDVTYKTVAHPKGRIIKSFPVIAPVCNADLVISVAKLKTHAFTVMTGAVKNMFGAIPGLYKAEYHFRLKTIEPFSDMLLDLFECINPGLCFIDAVTAMEGNGPTGGTPRDIGVIISSENAHEADMVGAHIMGIPCESVPTIKAAMKRNLCGEPETVGEDISKYENGGFKVPKAVEALFEDRIPPFVRPLANKLLKPKPLFNKDRCAGCGECAACCPAKAIKMTGRRPEVDLKKCISCFCCQELCPKKAVEVKRSKLMEFILKR